MSEPIRLASRSAWVVCAAAGVAAAVACSSSSSGTGATGDGGTEAGGQDAGTPGTEPCTATFAGQGAKETSSVCTTTVQILVGLRACGGGEVLGAKLAFVGQLDGGSSDFSCTAFVPGKGTFDSANEWGQPDGGIVQTPSCTVSNGTPDGMFITMTPGDVTITSYEVFADAGGASLSGTMTVGVTGTPGAATMSLTF